MIDTRPTSPDDLAARALESIQASLSPFAEGPQGPPAGLYVDLLSAHLQRLCQGYAEARGVDASHLTSAAGAPTPPPQEVEHIGNVYEQLMGYTVAPDPEGGLTLQPGPERRRTGSHYTPRALSTPIVARAFEPALRALGEAPSAEQLLSLRIWDPAMGAGAFLLQACRFLADQLVAAWARDGLSRHTPPGVKPTLHARRLVARRCIYGVDKNPLAVKLARASLWLLAEDGELAPTFADHALRHGDALVGLMPAQLCAFNWAPAEGERVAPIVAAQRRGARDVERLRVIADACVGAFFAERGEARRARERQRRLALVEAWLGEGDEAAGEALQRLAGALRAEVPAFHPGLEWPEIVHQGGMSVCVGNPPFLGGRRIRGALGDAYTEWLGACYRASKNADLSAHFFTRAHQLMSPGGALGLIATNTIAQGDTRTSGLARLVSQGARIYDATTHRTWPGAAAVTFSVVHLAAEGAARGVTPRLDGSPVEHINSQLQPRRERPTPRPLAANTGKSFQGVVLSGMGFTLTPAEARALIARDPRNQARILPYLGGHELNHSPTHAFTRYAISFGAMSLEAAEEGWPDLLQIVRERVKPGRDGVRRAAHRKHWWQHGDRRPALLEALSRGGRCLVASRVSKHLMFAWQPTDRLFSEATYVFPVEGDAWLAVLQSRVHRPWAWLHSSTMRDAGIRYSSSACFDTFPFPDPMGGAALSAAGAALHTARARYMRAHDRGLTATYNQLEDPRCEAPEIERLRRLHEAVDRATLDAYGWDDLEVPVYGAPGGAFEEVVLDRLFALNAARAERGASSTRG